jgi:hypothetical protein
MEHSKAIKTGLFQKTVFTRSLLPARRDVKETLLVAAVLLFAVESVYLEMKLSLLLSASAASFLQTISRGQLLQAVHSLFVRTATFLCLLQVVVRLRQVQLTVSTPCSLTLAVPHSEAMAAV